MTIEWNDDGSCWIKFDNGRSRYAYKGSELLARVKEGLSPQVRERGRDVTVYYRNPDGTLGVPAEEQFIPAGCERLEARTLSEQDELGRALAAQEHRKWEGSAEANAVMEEAFDNPRQRLIDKLSTGQVKGNLEREVIRLIIDDLDKEERDRNRISTEFHVHAREWGGY